MTRKYTPGPWYDSSGGRLPLAQAAVFEAAPELLIALERCELALANLLANPGPRENRREAIHARELARAALHKAAGT